MKRAELEHILRACSGNTGERDFIIIGSQSVLGKHPDAPRELRISMELDIYARDKPEEMRIEIERNLGELSRFAETFRCYADLVFIRAMLKHHFIRPVEIERLIASFDDASLRERLSAAFARCRQPEP